MFTRFKLFSVGIAGKSKEKNSNWLEVYPIEVFPTIDGTLASTENVEAKCYSYSKDAIDVKIRRENTVKARWVGLAAGNRVSAPDVMQGETVLLYRYAGNDEFFWDTVLVEPDLRKRERALYFWSSKENIQKEGENVFSKGYTFIVDTYDKHVGLHTSMSDEEKVAYDIQLDTKNGVFLLKDSNNNGISIQSEEGILGINMAKDMNVKIGNDTNIEIGNDQIEKIGNDYKLEVGNDISAEVSNHTNIKTKTFSVTNGSVELLALLSDLIQAMCEEKHIGNMGAPTVLDPGTMAKYMQIKVKLDTLKK